MKSYSSRDVIRMKKPDCYVYPAVFTYEEGEEIAVVFPDLDVATSGTTDEDAMLSARELLGLVLFGLEEDGDTIPAPSAVVTLPHEANEVVTLVDVFMPSVRLAQQNKSVSRTVSLPAWLNALALEKQVNFSQVLQSALMKQLGVQNYTILH